MRKAQKEVEAQIREDGENAAMDVGVHGIHPELTETSGTYEIPFKLWTECPETFYRSCTAFRNPCRRNRCGCPNGKTCWSAS